MKFDKDVESLWQKDYLIKTKLKKISSIDSFVKYKSNQRSSSSLSKNYLSPENL